MANIRKTFNFRNGVQVDDDNLIVNPLGLVGIGTTVPTEILDVRGTVKVVGLVTASEIYTPTMNVGVATITNLVLSSSSSRFVGGGVSISSGIITSPSTSGVVTYYGDGGRLLNLPTSQWQDVDVGLGFTSIYAQGYVGVGTYDPRFMFQVSGTLGSGTFASGVGIDSRGNVLATGIITASQFSGIGLSLTQLNADNISSGTIGTDRIPVLRTNQLPRDINAAGIITSSGGFIGTVRGDVYGNGIGIYTGSFFGGVVGIASTARDLTSDARVAITFISSNESIVSGSSTIYSRLNVIGSVGIGTTLTPSPSNFYVKQSGISSIQVISDNAESYITLSRRNDQTSNSASILYGNTNGYYLYSNSRSFDIINYDLGNVNTYIHNGTITGINTGSFNWIYGKDPTNPLMSLTYTGNLGLGNTNPSIKLDVVGSASISSNLNVIGNVSVGQSVTVPNLYVTNIADIPGLNLNSQTSNLNITSGVSTFNDIQANRLVYVIGSGSIGIGTTQPKAPFQIGLDSSPLTLSNSAIGIGTTAPAPGLGLDARSSIASFQGVGIGTTNPRSYVDFADAGRGLSSGAGSFVLLPNVSSAGRTAIDIGSPTGRTGGVIYNNTSNQFQGYNGSSWLNLGITTESITISTFGNRLIFTVAGIGSTSFILS